MGIDVMLTPEVNYTEVCACCCLNMSQIVMCAWDLHRDMCVLLPQCVSDRHVCMAPIVCLGACCCMRTPSRVPVLHGSPREQPIAAQLGGIALTK